MYLHKIYIIEPNNNLHSVASFHCCGRLGHGPQNAKVVVSGCTEVQIVAVVKVAVAVVVAVVQLRSPLPGDPRVLRSRSRVGGTMYQLPAGKQREERTFVLGDFSLEKHLGLFYSREV